MIRAQRGLCLTAFGQGRNEAKFPAFDQGLIPLCKVELYHHEQIPTNRDGGQDRTAAFHGCANRLPSAACETTGTGTRYFEGEVVLCF